MTSKKNNPKASSADLTIRVGVIEMRMKGMEKGAWRIYPDFILAPPREDTLAWTCKNLSERHTAYDLRYRSATLTFDDDGRKAVIY